MNRALDTKSFLIGFLLALVIVLLLGAGTSPAVQEVRVVGFSGHDCLPVTVKDGSLKVELVDVKYGVELPVLLKER